MTSINLVDTLESLLETIIIYTFLKLYLKVTLKNNLEILLFVSSIVTSTAVTIFTSNLEKQYSNLIGILLIAISIRLIEVNRPSIIFYYILLIYYSMYFSDFFSIIILAILLKKNIMLFSNQLSIYGLLLFICARMLNIILLGTYQKIFKTRKLNIFNKYLIIMDVVLSIIIITIDIMLKGVISYSNVIFRYNNIISRNILLLLLLMSIVVYLIIYLFSKLCIYYQSEQDKLKNQLTEKLLKSKIKGQQVKALELSKMKHDFKENFATIQYMINLGQYREATAYINDLIDINTDIGNNFLTNNIYIDAALNNWTAICKEKNIKIQIEVDEIPDFLSQPLMLSNIINNLLKNAVYASARLEPKERIIKVKIFKKKNYIIIFIKNRHHERELFKKLKNKNIFSGSEKGLGISIIKENVNKLNGEYTVKYNDYYFETIIVLPKIN